MNNERKRLRSPHLRPLSARLPFWDVVGEDVTEAVVDALIAIEIWKTDKAAGVRPD